MTYLLEISSRFFYDILSVENKCFEISREIGKIIRILQKKLKVAMPPAQKSKIPLLKFSFEQNL